MPPLRGDEQTLVPMVAITRHKRTLCLVRILLQRLCCPRSSGTSRDSRLIAALVYGDGTVLLLMVLVEVMMASNTGDGVSGSWS